MKTIGSIAILSSVFVFLAIPLMIGAVEEPPTERALPTAPVATGKAVLDKIDLAANWLFVIFVALSVIYLLIAAFQFVTAGGEAEKITEARQKLIYAVIGLVLALLVRGLPTVLRSIIV